MKLLAAALIAGLSAPALAQGTVRQVRDTLPELASVLMKEKSVVRTVMTSAGKGAKGHATAADVAANSVRQPAMIVPLPEMSRSRRKRQ